LALHGCTKGMLSTDSQQHLEGMQTNELQGKRPRIYSPKYYWMKWGKCEYLQSTNLSQGLDNVVC